MLQNKKSLRSFELIIFLNSDAEIVSVSNALNSKMLEVTDIHMLYRYCCVIIEWECFWHASNLQNFHFCKSSLHTMYNGVVKVVDL